MRPGKIQISPRIHAVWSEPSLGAVWLSRDTKFVLADNEDSDQTARMRRLIWVSVGRTCPKLRFLTLQFINFSVPAPNKVELYKSACLIKITFCSMWVVAWEIALYAVGAMKTHISLFILISFPLSRCKATFTTPKIQVLICTLTSNDSNKMLYKKKSAGNQIDLSIYPGKKLRCSLIFGIGQNFIVDRRFCKTDLLSINNRLVENILS